MVKTSRFYFFYAVFMIVLTPLIFTSSTNELYEFPKMYFIYFAGVPLISVWLIQKIYTGEKFLRFSLAPLLFVFSILLATLASSHLYTSVWGYYTRFSDCLISTLVFYGIYVVFKDKLSREDFLKIDKLILLTLIPISAYAIEQSSETLRVFSTFGQPNWYAQYVVMLLPLAIHYYFNDNRQLFWLILSVFGFYGFWLTYSMSGILGLAVAFLSYCLIYIKKLFKKDSILKLIILILFFVFIAITNLGVFKLRLDDMTKDIKDLLTETRVYAQDPQVATTPVERNLSDPGLIRSGLWKGTMQLIFSSPKIFFLGTGPETFPYAFQRFRPLELNYSSEWDYVFNKPHNYYLEIWAEQGLLGLLAATYLIVYVIKKSEIFILPGLIGFLFTNLFGWPTVSIWLLFWFWLARAEVIKKDFE